MRQKDDKIEIAANIKENKAYMEKRLGMDVSFDLGFREVIILKRKVHVYYLTGLCDSIIIQDLLKELVNLNDHESNSKKLPEIIENRLLHQQVESVKTMDESVDQVLSGLIVVFIDGERFAYVVDVRHYPGRTPEEPDTERVIRGSRDGYTENIIENTALTRRRLRDARLRHEMLKVGERSKTDVCVSYVKDIADEGLVHLIKKKIQDIEIDGISMADKTIEEFIIDRKWNPYPLVRYTERPDVAANHLLEGHVLILVDTSPSAIILPTTFFHHLQHAEEYRQAPAIGTFVRWIRFLAILASMYLLPLWLLFVLDPTILPKALAFIGPNEEGNIPITIQIVMAVIGIEFLRMAAIHTPTPLSTSMGLIAAVLIGQIAIDVGMFSPEVILYVSISAIGSYVTPSYELSVANKVVNIMMVIFTGLFGAIGFVIGITLHIMYLVNLKSIKTPYLWPFLPFNPKAMLQIIFRIPVPYSNSRPSIVHPKNNYRQPTKK
ncbi:spore germination protein XA [Oceanobacillus picturae]|uniref:Spore germination protein XA n=2 Tax=Oceanobacillus TaxID=182709 RepID=W9B5L4_9BACI|nr:MULTISPECIES: spore germination protein [Oceanobacillus]AVQ99285.1 spore germination protein [Oceanobacillus iheyensis]MCG3418794.1 spore germination protein [Oceanobacillus jordanicus]RIU96126.1 spore germination protein [Oceanobacillus picturae]CDO01985.1 Spore germination protein XA [Oceanobacillus picturae]GAQ17501.1 spore germination protein XA [Oceanobacillus picturae]